MRFESTPELELFAGVGARCARRAGRRRSSRCSASGRTTVTTRSPRDSRRSGWAELWRIPALLAPGRRRRDRARPGRGAALARRRGDARGAACARRPRAPRRGRVEGGEREPTLDGTGTLRGVAAAASPRSGAPSRVGSRHARLPRGSRRRRARARRSSTPARASSSARRSASLPAVQARLADAALARDGLVLCAWAAAATRTGAFRRRALAWAGGACREVTAHVQQVHGGVGFALEGGIHRYYRRAKSVQVWVDAVLRRARL